MSGGHRGRLGKQLFFEQNISPFIESGVISIFEAEQTGNILDFFIPIIEYWSLGLFCALTENHKFLQNTQLGDAKEIPTHT